MRMIREEVVTPATLTSNVLITETEWTPGTYTLGQQRYVGTDLYEVTAASTTDDPVAGYAKPETERTWVRIGKINRWKMFSEFIYEQTISASPLVVEIETSPTANAVALFGMDAASVEVVAYSGGVEKGRATKSLTNINEVTNIYEYFFQPITRVEEAVILNLPAYGTDRLVITITDEDGTVAAGKLVIGEAVVLGRTSINFGAGLEDFSIKERDDFGGWKFTERSFSRRADFDVFIDAVKVPTVLRNLAAVRTKPTVYIGDPDTPESIVIGVYKQAYTLRKTKGLAEMTFEIEGST